MQVLLTILAIAGLITIVIAITTYINIRLLSNVALTSSYDMEPPPNANEWAQDNHFEFVGNFNAKLGSVKVFISAWRHSEKPSFFCQYEFRTQYGVKRVYDLVTEFACDIYLTTCDVKDGNALPKPPGEYVQTLSDMSFDERWYKHIEMENYLMEKGQAQLVEIDKPFEESIVQATHRQAEFIRKIPLWPLQGVYWFFTRKRLRHNKSIKMQHEKGMIKLPNELLNICNQNNLT